MYSSGNAQLYQCLWLLPVQPGKPEGSFMNGAHCLFVFS